MAETLGEEDDKGKTAAKYILLTLRNKDLKGDTKAIEMLFERAYGKAKQFVDVTTPNWRKSSSLETRNGETHIFETAPISSPA